MTPRTQQNAATPNAARPQNQNRGLFGGLAGCLLGGLFLGGLFGMLMGSGFGGAAGFLGMLLQIALIAGLAMLAMRFFARRQQPASGPVATRNSSVHAEVRLSAAGFLLAVLAAFGQAVGILSMRPVMLDQPDPFAVLALRGLVDAALPAHDADARAAGGLHLRRRDSPSWPHP